MAGKVILVLLRTAIGLALIAAGLVIAFVQYEPGLMPSVRVGNSIVGPVLSLVGVVVTFWPAVNWLLTRGVEREIERDSESWAITAKDDTTSKDD
jgi:hypothetical protein